MIRAGIVGLGWWGKTLVDSVHGKSAAIRITAAQTRSPAKVADWCRDKGIALHDSLEAILADRHVDALVFATPHSEHEGHIARAAAAGKHVFVEKPIALDVASARRAIEAAARAKVVLAVDYQRRFHPNVAEIRARIADGRLGIPLHFEGEATAPAALFMPKDSWRTNVAEAPAGAMTGLGVHVVDGLIDLFGEVDEVHCINLKRAAIVDDTTSVAIRMRNGMSASVFCALSTAMNWRYAVYGSKGLAEISHPTLDTFRFLPAPSAPGGPMGQVEQVEHKAFNLLKAALEAFAAAIEGGPAYPTTADQLVHGVAVLEAVIESARTGQPVRVR